jgi:hypothetical protein
MATAPALQAAEYRLQVASIENKLFHRYVNTQGTPFLTYLHTLPRLGEALDNGTFSTQWLLFDREPRLMQAARAVPGQTGPRVLASTPPRPGQPWMTVTWEGVPGQTVMFRLSSLLVHYQELMEVAVYTEGALRRLPVYGVPLFGNTQVPVPTLSDTYIATAIERGTFAAWVAEHAVAHDGLSVVVGRSHDQKFPDAVYLLVQMPAAARTYQVVLAWRDREDLHKGHNLDGGDFNN